MICTSPRAQAIPAITSSPKEEWSDSSSMSCLPSLSNSFLLSFCSGSSTIHQTQRKISSMAKLFSTELPAILLPIYLSPSLNYPHSATFFPKRRRNSFHQDRPFDLFFLTSVSFFQKLLKIFQRRSAPKPTLPITVVPSLIIRRQQLASILIQWQPSSNRQTSSCTSNPAPMHSHATLMERQSPSKSKWLNRVET